ncbi:unnamed protein product [Schistosoma turkestanicum]|nr:unnamed protein product [Schistosoma turkestanicum]
MDMRKETSDRLYAAKEWGSYIFSKAMKSSEEAVRKITDQIDLSEIKSLVPLIREFEQAQADFAVTHQNKNDEAIRFRSSLSELPPWHPDICGLNDSNALSALKEQILALSQNPNNFLISPPEEAQLKWTSPIPESLLSEAQILLKEDPNLGSIRYQLVPSKISEDIFWRNYFYRVSLIQQSASLSAVMDSEHQQNSCNNKNSNNNGGITSDNSVSDTDFVCIEQNPVWSKMNANFEEKKKSNVDLNNSNNNNNNRKMNNSSLKVKKTSDKPLKISSTSSSNVNPANASRCSPTFISNHSPKNDSSHISSKTLEEQLEEEIAREVDELVFTKSENNSANPNNTHNIDGSVADEIDEELELEILAELESGNTISHHANHCRPNSTDNVKEASSIN